MTDSERDRVRFDVACALAFVSRMSELQIDFPEKLNLNAKAERLLNDCVDLKSFSPKLTSCKIRDEITSEDSYSLPVGTDVLALNPGGVIHIGGSGVTVQLLDKRLKRHYALKVPRASILAYEAPHFSKLCERDPLRSRIELEYDAFENERQISRRLSHQNVAQHYYGSSKKVPGLASGGAFEAKLPFSISEWIDGAQPLHDYLTAAPRSLREIISLLADTFSALDHIHGQQVIHWDLKCDNILVSKKKVAKIIDFGNAKLLDVERRDDLVATTTKGKYPRLRDVLEVRDTAENESRRFQIKLPDRSWNHPFIDLWMLGQEWNRCLKISEPFFDDDGDTTLLETRQKLVADRRSDTGSRLPEAWDCLRIIFDRILHPFSSHHSHKFIRGKSFDPSNLYYKAAEQVLNELSRVHPPFGAAQQVSELLVSLDEIVRLPVTGNSVFTERVAAVVESKIVQPTKLHYQLAQVREVFPGATHTRFEHLLGTLTTAAYFLRSLYLNDMNAFWRVSAEAIDVRAVLLASILHDAGHLAFGHFIEEMDDLLAGRKHGDYILHVLNECLRRIDSAATLPPAGSSGAGPAFSIGDAEIDQLNSIFKKHWCDQDTKDETTQTTELLQRLVEIFGPPKTEIAPSAYLSRSGTRSGLLGIMKSIVDGPMDADKLDYLRRDSLHSGVFFSSGIDLERFFESLRACVTTDEGGKPLAPSIGVSDKGVAPMETIITARYHLYSSVYWHRTVRCITAMLQRVISEVRLSLDDEAWSVFIDEMIWAFRQQDDRQALIWLRSKLEALNLLNKSLRLVGSAHPPASAGATVFDLVEALLGDRSRYFRMAFELGYSGPVERTGGAGVSWRERLHEAMCTAVHPKEARPANGVDPLMLGKRNRDRLAKLHEEFAGLFEARVSASTNTSFRIDTILLDVPEPGKDQIKGMFVDRRDKRLRGSMRAVDHEHFTELTTVSPIAKTLTDVFRFWARKVRIFMTRKDLERLEELGLEPGDVAVIWEDLLLAKFHIDPSAQLGLRFPTS